MHARLTPQVIGLRTYMRSTLGPELGLVGAELGVTIPVPDAADHYIGRRDPFNLNRCPAVFYPAAALSPEPAGQHGGMESAQLMPLRIDIVVIFKHSKPDQLELCLLGCSDALVNLIAADPSIGGVCDEAVIEYLDWEHADSELGALVASLIMSKELRT